MTGFGGREYYGGVDFYPTHLEGGQKTFEDGHITYCEAHHNMAIFYAQTDDPILSVDVIPIGKVTSDLSVFDTLGSREAICGTVMGTVFITVIGQCMGAGDLPAAESNFKRLMRLTVLLSGIWNAVILALTPLFLRFYALEPETARLVFWLVLLHNVFNAVAYPFSGALGSGLRAAGDVTFTMVVAIASTIGGRFLLSWLFGVVWNMGVMGIALAMCCDWVIRGVLYFRRLRSGKWKEFQVI